MAMSVTRRGGDWALALKALRRKKVRVSARQYLMGLPLLRVSVKES